MVNSMTQKNEVFSTPAVIPWLAYPTITQVYNGHLLKVMYVQGHHNTGTEEKKELGEAFHFILENKAQLSHTALEQQFHVELAQALNNKKSLASN